MKRRILSIVIAALALSAFAAPKQKSAGVKDAGAASSRLSVKRVVAIYRFTNEAKYAKGAP